MRTISLGIWFLCSEKHLLVEVWKIFILFCILSVRVTEMEDHVSTPSSADKTEQAQSREVSWSSMQQTEVGGPQKAGSGYPKVYNALGFSKAYNFPLCKPMLMLYLLQSLA